MDWKNHLEKRQSKKLKKKPNKIESEMAACEKNHYRETEFLFKHHFLTLL